MCLHLRTQNYSKFSKSCERLHSWPQLQSLDLYDNHLEGSIPASLTTLPLVKLQLQGNRLSGMYVYVCLSVCLIRTVQWLLISSIIRRI